jgi:hypothetical protein
VRPGRWMSRSTSSLYRGLGAESHEAIGRRPVSTS